MVIKSSKDYENNGNYRMNKFIDYENDEQKVARQRILTEREVPITGPPGTGKSTVISHCCFDLLNEYSPVLVTAPTNVMVNSTLAKIDLLLRRSNTTLPHGTIIRYGNTADLERSHPLLTKYSLDNIVKDVSIDNPLNKIEIGRKYFRNAKIILCTDYSAKDLVRIVKAGAIIVDEAGLVAIDRMAMLFSSLRENDGKLLVIGDDKQLPPVSNDFVAESLFRSILQQYRTTLLKTEYRFNKDILDLINPHYDFKLEADSSIKDISTSDIAKKDYSGINNNLTKILDHDKKIVFVDTNGVSQEQKTYINTGEISIVTQIMDGLMNMGIDDIIVTTPYKQQERLFQLNHIKKRDYYNTRLRIGTIDEFQGQESEVTIVSMVRSNNSIDYQKAVGFVNIPRSCVAFSRSKRKTIIVGDQKTLSKSKFLSRSIDTVVRKDGFFIWRN
jgi:superfamily I DNA and/or RNA helicase